MADKLFLSGTALLGTVLFQAPAWAQSTNLPPASPSAEQSSSGSQADVSASPGGSPAALQDDSSDIIVTANRREERSQAVGVSLTAISEATLDDRNIRSSEDLARLVPGLNATAASGSGVSNFVIRGVGQTDFSDHQEQPNATYQDGVYIPFATATGIPLFDIQRVEALRGPQGTLFGRNATGGLIQYISNKPDAGTSGAIEAAYGTRDLKRLQGFLNAGSDTIAGRIGYFYQSQDGFIRNLLGPDRGNKTVYALRGQLQVRPAVDTTFTIRAEGFNQNGTPTGYIATPELLGAPNTDLPPDVDAYGTGPGNDPNGYRTPYSGLTTALDTPERLRKRSRTYSLTIEQGLGDATLTSTSAYGKIFNNYLEDTDSSPLNTFTAESTSRAEDFQQELRINGSADGLRYTVGAFYLNIKGRYSANNDIVVSPALSTVVFGGAVPPGRVLQSDAYSLRTRSEAIFGQIEYDIVDKVTAILGARYTWDQFKYSFASQCQQTVIGVCGFFGGDGGSALQIQGIGPLAQDEEGSDWSGKAQLNFKPVDDVLLYASVSKGVKSAGFSAPLANATPIEPIFYKPENLYAYEIGEKAQFLDRRLTVNTSAYYYDYKRYQTFLFQTVTTQVLNRDAEVYGGELELSARPMAGLSANLSVAYNHFVVKTVFPGIENQRPINAPRLQVNWGLGKTFALSGDLDLDVGYAGRAIGAAFFNIVNAPLVRAPSYDVHDFNIRLDSKQGWYAAAYLNNAFDKRYQVGAFDLFAGQVLRQYGEVRTFSAAVGFKF